MSAFQALLMKEKADWTIRRILGSEIVTIYVGPKRKSFTLHKKLLCERSIYFLKAFAGGFKEGAEGVMYMEEGHVGAFDDLVNWIYRDQLPSFLSKDFADSIDGWCNFYDTVMEPLFFMAEKFCINELCNKILDKLQDSDLKLRVMRRGHLMVVYANTHEDSKLRKYYALLFAYAATFGPNVHPEGYSELVESIPDLLKSTPDLAMDFTILQFTYGYRFRERKTAVSFTAILW
ncbi:hypothetical protein LSUB1_G002410 [Lachnellula subtilissima]|uniref:BTB domain-containing protein n=1 Tax=Lachnellula subtilissima TaxID=602034 RepID=A0A8H8RTV9_9HELO|nr:hypothetical protein LSUB1_G002410 [Lachnellula subtilissima]